MFVTNGVKHFVWKIFDPVLRFVSFFPSSFISLSLGGSSGFKLSILTTPFGLLHPNERTIATTALVTAASVPHTQYMAHTGCLAILCNNALARRFFPAPARVFSLNFSYHGPRLISTPAFFHSRNITSIILAFFRSTFRLVTLLCIFTVGLFRLMKWHVFVYHFFSVYARPCLFLLLSVSPSERAMKFLVQSERYTHICSVH